MPFECKKYHCYCEARCCGIVPIPAIIWQANQHRIQRQPVEKHKVKAGKDKDTVKLAILPVTEDGYCPFLTEGLECAIYEDRPEICKRFGDESHVLMCCPMQKADGASRAVEECRDLYKRTVEFMEQLNG